ncbi:NADP-dependent oxidoreductase [Microbacterium gorillae]|uniref:NADP-dependent oxidoreductase n=1 Tax=Microbacterium gorillae TaxID=1231063 RepID=UPI00058C6ED0|nr:NADP-dependent oxidoreductase [Microbacterium gorillae]
MSRIATYDTTGGPEVLHLTDVPDVEPGAGEVAIRVRAVGLNPFDAKVRSGFIPMEAPFPRRIGSDLAGTVDAVGRGAVYADGTPVSVGDEVMGRAAGAVAERVVTRPDGLCRRPEALPVEVAASLNVPGLTAVSCLVTVPVTAADTVLVGGAAGAVGIIAAQLVRDAGARAIGTAAERNHDLLRSVGVEPVIYGDGLVDRVRALGEITAVIDCHGRDALDAGIALGVPVERMVAIAAYGAEAELGVHNAERAARTPANLAQLADRAASGDLVLPIAATFPLDEVRQAFATMEGPHAAGKIVIVP